MLGSGFWLIATERFDPHTARLNFGRIAGVGTIAGLGGALVTERIGATLGIAAMLPLLAALNLVCAWQVRELAGPKVLTIHDKAMDVAPDLAATSPRSGLRVLAGAPYLRNLAALVLLGTVAAALADYVFKAQAVEAFGRGDALLQFFALYYAGVSLLAFVVQSVSRAARARAAGPRGDHGHAVAGARTSADLVALVFPGLGGALVARAGESTLRSSLFKTGYEIFFTPIASHDKRAAKSIIDVGFDRLGDAIGGGLIRLLIMLPSASQYVALMGAAIGCSAIAVAVAQRLSRGYIHTLERSLLDRAVELELSDVGDITTQHGHDADDSRTAAEPPAADHRHAFADQRRPAEGDVTMRVPTPVNDPELREIVALRSRNRDAVLQVLRAEEGLPAALIPHVIPLLAWDPVAEDAVRALRKVAEERVGELVDALLDPNQPFAVAATAGARVLGVRVAARGRRRAARPRGPALRGAIPVRTIAGLHPREEPANPHRQGARLRRRAPGGRGRTPRLGEPSSARHRRGRRALVRGRVSQGSRRAEPGARLHAAVARAADCPAADCLSRLHTDDPGLRGTALEYLEGVLPPDIRDRLWPFLSDRPRKQSDTRARDEILADLLRSNESIMLNLEELQTTRRAPAHPDALSESGLTGL